MIPLTGTRLRVESDLLRQDFGEKAELGTGAADAANGVVLCCPVLSRVVPLLSQERETVPTADVPLLHVHTIPHIHIYYM